METVVNRGFRGYVIDKKRMKTGRPHKENLKSGTYEIQFRLLVPSNTELDKVISLVSNVKGVLKVRRS